MNVYENVFLKNRLNIVVNSDKFQMHSL